VLGALFERTRSGRGHVVEVSMLEAMAHFAVEPFAAYFALGTVPKSSDRPRLAQAHILHTADGGMMAIHLSSLEKFWTGLVAALDAPELARDPRFATRLLRIENYEALGAELSVLSEDPIEAGSSTCIAVRPEKITISREMPDGRDRNVLKGTVWDLAYFGDQSLYRVRLQSGAVLQVSAQNLRRSAKLTVEWDDEVFLSWDIASTVLLRS